MLHLAHRTYLNPIEFFEHPLNGQIGMVVISKEEQHTYKDLDTYLEELSLTFPQFIQTLLTYNEKRLLYCSRHDFLRLTKSWYEMLFDSKDSDDLDEFLSYYQTDIRIKANRFDYNDKVYYGMRSFNCSLDTGPSLLPALSGDQVLSAEGLSFEVLLYNALSTNQDIFWKPLLSKVEILTWKKLINDWLVLKNQILNAFSNDLSSLLPVAVTIPGNPEERLTFLKNHHYFKWIFDPDFRPENWKYVRDNYDPDTYAILYSSWIRFRKQQELDKSNVQYKRILEIISLIKNGEWKELLTRDLAENWVSVYVESSDYKKFNLALVGRIYDLSSQKKLEELKFLKLSARVQ